ncbi:MAG: LPS export ABC transporter periplasmic protein LptC [Bacteroidota bacterium]|nr:LPS export ABC transporter periplasmic protein LptC [Bacteroidota bacterium]
MIFSCENNKELVKDLANEKKVLPAESATDIEIIYSDRGVVRMKLNAPVLERYLGDNPYVEFPEGIQVVFFDSLKQPESKLTANYAINRESEKIMEAKRDVVVINEKGEVLNTEHLIWNEEKASIYTEEFVKITTADEIIMGKGMEADQQFTKYKIKNITGTINIKSDEDNTNP